MKKKNPQVPPITINEEVLRQEHFVQSGIKKYTDAVMDFSCQVKDKAINYAKADLNGDEYEVNSSHVNNASRKVFVISPKRHMGWCVCFQIMEYISSGFVGAGTSNLSKSWGVPLALTGLIICTILLLIRKLHLEEK